MSMQSKVLMGTWKFSRGPGLRLASIAMSDTPPQRNLLQVLRSNPGDGIGAIRQDIAARTQQRS